MQSDGIAENNSSDSRAAGSGAITRLNIYPNPAKTSTNLNVNIAKAGHVAINLVDVSGRQLKQLMNANVKSGEFSLTVNTAGIASGVYYVRMITNDETLNTKLVVQ